MCELLRDYMGGPLQSKALKLLPPGSIVAGRKDDSQLPAPLLQNRPGVVILTSSDPERIGFHAERQDLQPVAAGQYLLETHRFSADRDGLWRFSGRRRQVS